MKMEGAVTAVTAPQSVKEPLFSSIENRGSLTDLNGVSRKR